MAILSKKITEMMADAKNYEPNELGLRELLDTALWGHDSADAVEAMLECHNYDGGGILAYMDKLYELLARREK